MKSTCHSLKYCLLLYFLCILPSLHFGQNLRQSVVGNSGTYFENNNVGNLHWTLGEISVETYQSDIHLAQGFHQTYFELFTTPAWSIESSNFQIKAFPNPTMDWLYIQTENAESFDIVLTNLLGQILLPKHSFSFSTHLDLSDLPEGLYLAHAFFKNQPVAIFKIQKIQF